jgi:hypothetical protein
MHDYTYTEEEERRMGLELDDRKRSLSFAIDNILPVIKINVSPQRDNTNPRFPAHLNVSDTLQLTQSYENALAHVDVEKILPENYLSSVFGENIIIV